MKISEAWLREWVNPPIGTQTLVDQLTMAGLEVDAVTPVAGAFSGVVVAEILRTEAHPDAEKLRVCAVSTGGVEVLQIVCGAPNARPGIKVPLAQVGAELPGNFTIKKAKLRGVESFGMLCSQVELRVGEDDSGLWELPADAVVGADLREYMALDDHVIEVDLTPNRSDCLSIAGLAREVGVLNRCGVKSTHVDTVPATHDETLKVVLEAQDACPRYVGRVLRNIDISRPSPQWLQEKLRRCGLRSIDPVVDATNFVLLELGQPMHAFDLSQLQGDIHVRFAYEKESLTLLDGQTLTLETDTLVIADGHKALALAGIMGGKASAVSDSTRDIFLESAFFSPLAIAGKARRYGLHTDASHRFERGVDYAGAHNALERATALILEICGGEPGPTCVVDTPALPSAVSVTLRKARVAEGLGFAIADDEVLEMLTRLGFELSDSSDTAWIFRVPSYRFDVAIEEDLLEELARIYGYNRLPIAPLALAAVLPSKSESRVSREQLERTMIVRGYQEVITYSFIDRKLHELFDASTTAVALLNPISSDLGVMRSALIPGLVNTLKFNLNRQKLRARLFETGLRFVPDAAGLKQEAMIAALSYGNRNAPSWSSGKAEVDFYDIKGDLEALLAHCGGRLSFVRSGHPALHPGQSADVVLDGEIIGCVGAVHPRLTQALDIPKAVFVFELQLAAVLSGRAPRFQGLSRFPEVTRDLAVLVARDLSIAELENSITTVAGEHLKNLKVFDVYSGEGIDPQRKSVAFNLTFQHPSRTLSEDEITKPMASIVKRLEEDFDARLR